VSGVWFVLLSAELAGVVYVALTWRKRPACPWCGSRLFSRHRRRTYDGGHFVVESNLLECDRCLLAEGAPA